ncbi:hypothetical protein [Maricaulis sp.]|uniref:hypothetical protein n=1 Tax=Maricaulis sp. TaxID=1486257 RepID=UPI00329764CA
MSTANSALPVPPERRGYYPIPDRLEDARTPIERCCALVGGVENFAHLLNRDTKTLYAWRSRYNGYFPNYMREPILRALEEAGYVLPPDFLDVSEARFRPSDDGRVTPLPVSQ